MINTKNFKRIIGNERLHSETEIPLSTVINMNCHAFKLILIDIQKGISLCQYIRTKSNVSLIFLTSKNDEKPLLRH